MIVFGAVLFVLVFAWALWLPGELLGRLLVPDVRGCQRLALTGILSFALFAVFWFVLAGILETPLSALFVLAGSTIANVACLVLLARREARAGRPGFVSLLSSFRMSPADILLLAGTFVLSILMTMFGVTYQGGTDVIQTVGHCLNEIAIQTVSNGPRFAAWLYDAPTDNLIALFNSHTTNGLHGVHNLFEAQRVANPALAAPHVALFGSAAWMSVNMHATVALVLSGIAACRRLGSGWVSSGVAGALTIFALHVFLGYGINENIFPAAIMAWIFLTIVNGQSTWREALILGLLLGILGGTRHVMLPMAGSAVLLVLLNLDKSRRDRFLSLVWLIFGFVLAAVPWAWVNLLQTDTIIAHPSLMENTSRHVATNELFGFQFRSVPLNWPFIGQVVHSPWMPFPNFVWVPLWMLSVGGLIPTALAVVGAIRLSVRLPAKVAIFSVGIIPIVAAILLVEVHDWTSATYLAVLAGPILVAMASGLDTVLTGSAGRRVAALVGIGVTAVLLMLVAANPLFEGAPTDPRITYPRKLHPVEKDMADTSMSIIRDLLTRPGILPRVPDIDPEYASFVAGSIRSLPEVLGRGSGLLETVHESGQVIIYTAYPRRRSSHYEFTMAGSPARHPCNPFNLGNETSHVILSLPYEQVKFKVESHAGYYVVDIFPDSEPTKTNMDFTFLILSNNPPTDEVLVRYKGEALGNMSVTPFGEAERPNLLVTNYPAEVVSLDTLEFFIDGLDWEAEGDIMQIVEADATARDEFGALVVGCQYERSWSGPGPHHLMVARKGNGEKLVIRYSPSEGERFFRYIGDPIAVMDLDTRKPGERILKFDRVWMPFGEMRLSEDRISEWPTVRVRIPERTCD